MPANQHQTLSDLPLWIVALISLAGLSGELWRAEAVAGITFGELIKRVLLRWGASFTFGMCAALVLLDGGHSRLLAGGIGGMIACNGADLVNLFYTQWIKHKLGIKSKGDEPA